MNRALGKQLFAVEQAGLVGSGSREVLASRGSLALRFLLNLRARSMRIIDFRAGPHPEKLALVEDVARREGMQRAYTLVEREEAPTWMRLGFSKEGVIPGFYKRSDAHIMGLLFEESGEQESAVRIKISEDDPGPDKSERIYQAAKKVLRSQDGVALPRVKICLARSQDEERAREVAGAGGRELTDFAPFSRDVEQYSYLCTARGGFSLLVGVEVQPCFDNARLDLLVAPRGDKELLMMAGALRQVCEPLVARGIVTAFTLVPAESVELTAIMLAAGFKKTALMPRQLWVYGQHRTAQLWSRKLTDPG